MLEGKYPEGFLKELDHCLVQGSLEITNKKVIPTYEDNTYLNFVSRLYDAVLNSKFDSVLSDHFPIIAEINFSSNDHRAVAARSDAAPPLSLEQEAARRSS